MPCSDCCNKDKNGNWTTEPCCGHSGVCQAEQTGTNIGLCACCGAEMFKENEHWFHHTQKNIPYDKRGTVHLGP